ncbi:hypothetical protein RvY_12057-4 [Ramazzottius varieornatus]|nr:hypothetical protein RvY_12057-4 [Ramazzottius varieornatus]
MTLKDVPDEKCFHDGSSLHNLGLKDLLINLRRLLTSLSFLCRTSSMFVDGMVVAGAFHFLPLYFVQNLGSSQKDAAIFGGLLPLISIVAGNVTGGIVIKRFKLQPRHVGLLLAIPSFVFAAGLYGCIGIQCDHVNIVGVPNLDDFRDGNIAFNNSVCPSCACSEQQYGPVCAVETNTNYFSPCHAGCRAMKPGNSTGSRPVSCSYRHTAGAPEAISSVSNILYLFFLLSDSGVCQLFVRGRRGQPSGRYISESPL